MANIEDKEDFYGTLYHEKGHDTSSEEGYADRMRESGANKQKTFVGLLGNGGQRDGALASYTSASSEMESISHLAGNTAKARGVSEGDREPFKLPEHLAKKYPKLAEYLKNGIQEVVNNEAIMSALKKYGEFTDEQVETLLEWGKGPEINVTDLDGGNGAFMPNIESEELQIDTDIVEQLENATGEDREAALLLVVSTILHESVHYGDDQDGVDYTEGHGEEGQAFEEAVYGRDIDYLDDAKEVLNGYNIK